MPKNINGKIVSYEIIENGFGRKQFEPGIETIDPINNIHKVTLVDSNSAEKVWTYTETSNQFIFDYDNGASVVLNLPFTVGEQTTSSGYTKVLENGEYVEKYVTAVNTVKAVNETMDVSYNNISNVLYVEQVRSDLDEVVKIYFVKDSGLQYLNQGGLIYRKSMD